MEGRDKAKLLSKNQVAELRCDEVRWFHKAKKDEKWTKLCGRDSLLIEVQYRFSRGINLDGDVADETRSLASRPITILADLYKVDIEALLATTIYWDDDPLELCRGRWLDTALLQPIDDELAELIEAEHLNVFRGHNIPATPVYSDKEGGKKPLLASISHKNVEIRWHSVIDVELYVVGVRGKVLKYIPFVKRTTTIRRSYPLRAVLADGPKPVGHLILVIPGIGQKMYRRAIIDNTASIRENVDEIEEQHFRLSSDRPMLLPIEWRSELVLDGDTVEVATLPYVEGLRNTLNTSALDLLYYTSAAYRTEIIAGLAKVLQRTYSRFMEYHPDYEGKVSLFAHSLGSVIAYDILSQWSPLSIYESFVDARIAEFLKGDSSALTADQKDKLTSIAEARQQVRSMESAVDLSAIYRSAAPKLPFQCDTLFSVGSPLGVFLALRGGATVENVVPKACVNLVNLFHPTDPVAYRLEPLLVREYWYVRPLRVHWSGQSAAAGGDYSQMKPQLHNSRWKRAARDKAGQIIVRSSTVAQQLSKMSEATADKEHTCEGQPNDDAKKEENDIGFEVGAEMTDGMDSPQSPVPPPRKHRDNSGNKSCAKTDVEPKDSTDGGASFPSVHQVPGRPADVGIEIAQPISVHIPTSLDAGRGVVGPFDKHSHSAAMLVSSPDMSDDESADKAPSADKGWFSRWRSAADGDDKKKGKPDANLEDAAVPKDGQQFVNELPQDKRLSQRLDFMLRQSATEVNYLSALSSHTCYWESVDVATFIMQTLYPGLMERKK